MALAALLCLAGALCTALVEKFALRAALVRRLCVLCAECGDLACSSGGGLEDQASLLPGFVGLAWRWAAVGLVLGGGAWRGALLDDCFA